MGKPIESGNIYTRIPSECCCRGGTPADKVPRVGPGTLAAATPKAPENAEAFDYYREISSVLGDQRGAPVEAIDQFAADGLDPLMGIVRKAGRQTSCSEQER